MSTRANKCRPTHSFHLNPIRKTEPARPPSSSNSSQRDLPSSRLGKGRRVPYNVWHLAFHRPCSTNSPQSFQHVKSSMNLATWCNLMQPAMLCPQVTPTGVGSWDGGYHDGYGWDHHAPVQCVSNRGSRRPSPERSPAAAQCELNPMTVYIMGNWTMV